jgi:hypothetical protein
VPSCHLSKLQKAARDGQCRLIYFDEAGFSASPSVQRGWSPRGKPHCVTPNPHCRRSVTQAGFTRNAVLDVILVVAASTITNYTGSVTQPTLEQTFQEHAWKA